MKRISLIVPCLNEEQAIPAFKQEVDRVFKEHLAAYALAQARGQYVAADQLIHLLGRDLRVLEHSLDDLGAHISRVHLGQAAQKSADGCAPGGNDVNLLHGYPSHNLPWQAPDPPASNMEGDSCCSCNIHQIAHLKNGHNGNNFIHQKVWKSGEVTFDEFEKALQSKGIRDYRIICKDARGEYGFRRAPGCII